LSLKVSPLRDRDSVNGFLMRQTDSPRLTNWEASPVAKIQATYHSFTAVLAIASLALTLTMCVADESVMTTDALADGQDADFLALDPALE
jgi:hypothetical protein